MKDEALALVRSLTDPAAKLNLLREYLQALALRSLHESEAFLNLAFVGGTALRFIAMLPRFSEDLDFSLHIASGYQPERWLKKMKNDLQLAGFNVSVTWNNKTAVHKAWIKTADILKETGLATVPEQSLSIKLEIDTQPPAGATITRSVITRHRLLALQHYDLSSLMAGKVHALLVRAYPKGRDWYDLLWYRGHRPPLVPNLALLKNALNQTMGADAPNANAWAHLLCERFKTLDSRKLVNDVAPFLEHPADAALITKQNIRAALME